MADKRFQRMRWCEDTDCDSEFYEQHGRKCEDGCYVDIFVCDLQTKRPMTVMIYLTVDKNGRMTTVETNGGYTECPEYDDIGSDYEFWTKFLNANPTVELFCKQCWDQYMK